MKESPARTHCIEEKSPVSARPRVSGSFPALARIFLTAVLFLAMSLGARADWGKPAPDFSNYNVPLYQQVTNRIKAKIFSRLGEGRSTHDRYFLIPFAYENRGNDPEFSHSFMTVIRVLADKKQPKRTAGLRQGSYKNREFEAFTISWLPADFTTESELCVFKGFGARLIASKNQCQMTPGRSFTLEETLKLGVNARNAICMWGPYEMSKGGFDLSVKRLRLLETGSIKYLADDRLTRKDRTAINCFHAMSGLYELFPNGGLFGTGFKMWGLNGTARVLIEYNETARIRGLLLEPVDEKNDRHGFVYAETPESRIYNPFKNTASAYRK